MTNTEYKNVGPQSLEVLKKRKQALEEKLEIKLQQLKSMCLQEAEIIGKLPQETPSVDPSLDRLTSSSNNNNNHNKSQRPPQPLPTCSINLATRPLPLLPSPSCSSASSCESSAIHHSIGLCDPKVDESELYQNICDFENNKSLEATLKSVRSSIVRTPIAVKISTDICQSVNLSSPTKPASSTSSHSSLPPTKIWSETDLDSAVSGERRTKISPRPSPYPGSRLSSIPLASSSSSSSLMHSPALSTGLEINVSHCQPHWEETKTHEPVWTETDLDSVKSDRKSKVSPRPSSIPMSPTIPPAGNGLEVNVLSVGHVQPYWEETKPYELSDFFKYSVKHRNKKASGSTIPNSNVPVIATLSSISLNDPSSHPRPPVHKSQPQPPPPTQHQHHPPPQQPVSSTTINPTKTDPYKDDANYYENYICEKPTIV